MEVLRFVAITLALGTIDADASNVIKLHNGFLQPNRIYKIGIVTAKKRNATRIHIKKCCGIKKCKGGTTVLVGSTSRLQTPVTTKNLATTTVSAHGSSPDSAQPPLQEDTSVETQPSIKSETLSLTGSTAILSTDTTTGEITFSTTATSTELFASASASASTSSQESTTVSGTSTITPAATISLAATTTTLAATTVMTTAATTTTTVTTTTAATTTTTVTTTTAATTTTTVTTTTTPAPLCLPYTCTSNFSLGTDGRVKASSVLDGILKESGNRQYMFSTSQKSWTDAGSACCSLGMMLLSLETTEEYIQISKIVKFSTELVGEYFTSGSDNKVENSFVWCSSNNTAVTSPSWGASEPSDKTGSENCVTVTVTASQNATIGDRSCTTPMKYICELPIVPKTSSCLAYPCETDPRYIGSDGEVNVTAANPGGDFLAICGRIYFIGQAGQNWSNSGVECCKRKMTFAAIETDAEQACITKYFSSIYGRPFAGLNAWVAGTDLFHEGIFTWCYADNTEENVTFSNILRWRFNQPDNFGNNENCMHYMNDGGLPPTNMVFNDENCAGSKRFICETALATIPFPECPSITCQQEPPKVNASVYWKSTSDGDFYNGCGKQYFVSKSSKTRDAAMAECCKYGLKLLSIESDEEIACIADFNAAEAKASGQYWTSGSTLGPLTISTPGWCTTQKFLYNTSAFYTGQPDNPSTERCIAFQLSNTALLSGYGIHDVSCSAQYNFICEGDVPPCEATCPGNCASKLNQALFNSKNELVDTNSYGRWVTGCGGRTYLFSPDSKSWDQAYDICCKIGMTLLKLETVEEFNCFYELNKNNSYLMYAADFWTGANDRDCLYRFKWCDTGEVLYRNDSRWLLNQPNNAAGIQACVVMSLSPTVTFSTKSLNDWDCSSNYRYVCEMPALPVPTGVVCAEYPCATQAAQVSEYQSMSSTAGVFKTACGRKYFFSKNTLSNDLALTECCKYGMRLLSIETVAEQNCLVDLNNADMKYSSISFWTSAVNDGIGRTYTYGWCPSGTFVDAGLFWGSGQPDNVFTENCVTIVFSTISGYSQNVLHSSTCSTGYRYICEEQ
ncbi:macrophage mannose receptor 1-like [Cloeon dipterum]|uniref:macrophage mannose receptor 1-like n=1 Tax=Cloeon dipterum TaxID=197152 RepID=UPI00321F9239